MFELDCLQPTCTPAGVAVLRFMQKTQTVQEPRCMAALGSSGAYNIDQQPASQSTEMQILTAHFASSPVLSVRIVFTAMSLCPKTQIVTNKACDADHHKGCQIYVHSRHWQRRAFGTSAGIHYFQTIAAESKNMMPVSRIAMFGQLHVSW